LGKPFVLQLLVLTNRQEEDYIMHGVVEKIIPALGVLLIIALLGGIHPLPNRL